MSTTLTRQFYIEQNTCPNCKCRTLQEGYTACEICREAEYKWRKENRIRKNIYNKNRYEALKSQGLCIDCKTKTNGNVYCETCTTNRYRNRAYKRPRNSRNRWSKR